MYKDQVIFEKDEITKDDGTPYKVYTPYSRKWLFNFETQSISGYPSEQLLTKCYSKTKLPSLNLKELGFSKSTIPQPKYFFNSQTIDTYEATRNFPSMDKTSRIGAALRFGTISLRQVVLKAASRTNNTFLKELI